MSLMARYRHPAYAAIAIAVSVLAGCAGQMEPAQRSIGDIEAIVIAASSEAAKYVPDQLTDVQGKLGELKASFDKKDYSAVLRNAPAVMSAAQGLAGAAAAKEQELMKALTEKGYDVNYAWGMNKHGQKMGGAILPDMMRWLWRDAVPYTTDPKNLAERGFKEPAAKK